MRAITELFTVDGQGILVPDADVTVTCTDVEGESVRDRSGMLHRCPLRRVTAWEFSYDTLSDQERTYMENLLSQPVFPFTSPGRESVCYCKGISMDYHDAARGQWRNFRFRVEEV